MNLNKNFFLILILNNLHLIIFGVETPEGALIAVSFNGEVGFNLDDISSLESVSNYIDQLSDNSWLEKAKMQVSATIYNQMYRVQFLYPKLQLPIPPKEVWNISFTSNPKEKYIQNHLFVTRNYFFYSVLVGNAKSINASEPLLVDIGGEFNDTYYLPADPEILFQKTGYACLDESSFPSNTVNSENALSFFDQNCEVEPYIPPRNRTYNLNQIRCHWTQFPNESCIDALEKHIGYIELNMTWTRLKWNINIADKYRVGLIMSETADLMGYKYNLENQINIGYRFFSKDSCVFKESSNISNSKIGCVGKPGWRQLLKFTSSTINIGKTDLHMGKVTDKNYLDRGVYEFDPCHLHYHFEHYETYKLANINGRKIGFCIQTTNRFYNNEWISFNTPYSYCSYQGISPGWGDDYTQGLDCQWMDVTDLNKGILELQVQVNPDNFICEGIPILKNSQSEWILTNFTTQYSRIPVYRQACNFTKNYNQNNNDKILINYTGMDSIVTLPCRRNVSIGPYKDCGFQLQYDNMSCTPNEKITIKLVNNGNSVAIVRICETSKVLGHSTFCEYVDSIANIQLDSDSNAFISLTFTCPRMRSSEEPGGLYSILVSGLTPNEQIPNVSIPTKTQETICIIKNTIRGIFNKLFGTKYYQTSC